MLRATVVVLVFTGARRLLFTSSILVANKSLTIFNITKMAAKRSQILKCHDNVLKVTVDEVQPCLVLLRA